MCSSVFPVAVSLNDMSKQEVNMDPRCRLRLKSPTQDPSGVSVTVSLVRRGVKNIELSIVNEDHHHDNSFLIAPWWLAVVYVIKPAPSRVADSTRDKKHFFLNIPVILSASHHAVMCVFNCYFSDQCSQQTKKIHL